MYKLLLAAFALLPSAACSTTPSATTTPFETAAASPEHGWLRQLVGEWRVTSEASMGADQPPTQIESSERVRAIGELWVHSEGSAQMHDQPFTSLHTLGFDPAQDCFSEPGPTRCRCTCGVTVARSTGSATRSRSKRAGRLRRSEPKCAVTRCDRSRRPRPQAPHFVGAGPGWRVD